MSVPTEKPDPIKDYEAYKAWRKAKKAAEAGDAPSKEEKKEEPVATSTPVTTAPEAAPPASAPPASGPAKVAVVAAKSTGVSPMPHPINDYAAYKIWKQSKKSGGKSTVAMGAVASTRKKAAHAAKFNKKKKVDRRSVLMSFGGAMWLIFTGFLGVLSAAMGRFMFPNVLYEPPTTFKIGRPEDFLPNSVDIRFKGSRQIWVIRDELGIYVLKAVCTHLGCTPAWMQGDMKFKCPCHGSGYRITGMNFEGPAPRPLERHRVTLADDGQIVVDSSKVFLQPSDWTNPEAFIPA